VLDGHLGIELSEEKICSLSAGILTVLKDNKKLRDFLFSD
jgi:hypothetical protein